jgi:hypothetical protein
MDIPLAEPTYEPGSVSFVPKAVEKTPSLFEVADLYAKFYDFEEDTETALPTDLFDNLRETIKEKTHNICALVRALEAEADAIKKEEERLAARRKARENRAQDLKNYLCDCLVKAGEKRVATPLFTALVQSTPRVVAIEGGPYVTPIEYYRVIPEKYELDKKRILQEWRSTQKTPAGTEVLVGQSLRII